MADRKAKTHKGRKIIESKQPKVYEDPKNSLFINTSNSNEILRMVMNDLVIYINLVFMQKGTFEEIIKKESI